MNIDDLKYGQLVKARWGKAAGADGPTWGEWCDVTVGVQRDLRDPMKKVAVLFLLAGPSGRVAWCNYDPRINDMVEAPEGLILSTGVYYLQVEGLKKPLPTPEEQ